MSARRLVGPAALGFVATAAHSLLLLIFAVVMLPSSGPPSEGAAISSAFEFWLVGACATWSVVALSGRAPLIGATIWVAATGALLALAVWVGPRFERARLDSCLWGRGGFDQPWCSPERDSLPGVNQAWFGVALLTSLVLGALVVLGVRGFFDSRRELPPMPAHRGAASETSDGVRHRRASRSRGDD